MDSRATGAPGSTPTRSHPGEPNEAIEIVTLGREAIRRGGSELDGITGHKQKFALLTFVASEGPVSRDRLLGMFWPDREEDRARHSLSQALYALRRELGGEYVVVDGDSISTHATRFDVDRLERAIEAVDWEAVVELYSGPFLAQFVLNGAPEFESWQTATRTRLARLARKAFPKVIESRMGGGDLREALAIAARWVRLDPLEDEAQHIYITLLAQSGQRTTALEQFENYRERLRRELDIEPLEGTLALVDRIRAGLIPEYRPLAEPVAAPASPPAPADTPEPEPTLVADEEPEPSLIQQLWARRIPHVGLIYLFVVWFGTRLVGDLVFEERLADWVLPAATFLLVLGLPVAIVVAWAHPARPMADGQSHLRVWPRWAERVRGGQVGWLLTGIALLLGVGHTVANRPPGELQRNHVVIFPFFVLGDQSSRVGEDIATWIGSIIEKNTAIRYTDGWYQLGLGGTQIGNVTRRDFRSNALAIRAGFWLQGGVEFYGDSVRVRAEIHDVAGDSAVARAESSGPLTSDWVMREGESIVGQLLPSLIEVAGGVVARGVPQQIQAPSDTPPAAENFLLAEQLYRRLQYGEALRRYESAVAADSSFARAALKGAMAAGWVREWARGAALTEVATQRSPFLEPSRAHFARGLGFYYRGEGDSAIAAFRSAAELAPDWLEARSQLGETYYHLLTSAAPADSLAWEAFTSVRSDNPEFYPVLYHLIGIALRDGDLAAAEGMIDDFRRLEPDTAMTLHAANIMFDCVGRSPQVLDWPRHVRDHPASVYEAGQGLVAGGRQAGCARAAFTAILEHLDPLTRADTSLHFGASLGLISLLAAEGRAAELAQLVDQLVARDPRYARGLSDMIVLAALAGLELEDEARVYIDRHLGAFPDGERSSRYLWMVGAWAHAHSQPEQTAAFADSLRARFDGPDGEPLDSLLARSLDARIALAEGDTAAAMSILEDLVPPTNDLRGDRFFFYWESRPWEAVTLAELQRLAGDHAAAIRTAASLDAPARPLPDLVQLPNSLVVRIRAAGAMGDRQLEQVLRTRLRELARTDLLEGLPE